MLPVGAHAAHAAPVGDNGFTDAAQIDVSGRAHRLLLGGCALGAMLVFPKAL